MAIFFGFISPTECLSENRSETNGTSNIINAYGREYQSLNGEWNIIIDPNDRGYNDFWKNQKPRNNNEFREYSFDDGYRLNVPGDFNSQMPELKYYEGTVWYGRYFDIEEPHRTDDKRILYFAGVSNVANVYLNGEYIGSHEGGFTPFSFDVTDRLKPSENFIAVAVNNKRKADGIPSMNFDWWNYGGITRDVMLLSVPKKHIVDYFLRLNPNNPSLITVDVEISEPIEGEQIEVSIPEIGANVKLVTNTMGKATGLLNAKKFKRWEPGNPKLYEVFLKSRNDTVSEKIGFRTIETKGNKIIMNGVPIFLKGVNLHEEIPQRKGRAFTDADAAMLLHEAKEMGVNFIRLAHYPHNEHIVRMAEQMGLVLWEEIPIWQNIDFGNPKTDSLARNMMSEMIERDKNRASIIMWSVANETWPSEARDKSLLGLIELTREMDNSRLVTAAFNNPYYDREANCFVLKNDPIAEAVDVIGVNKYIGWYEDWYQSPDSLKWKVLDEKPLIFSEFGGEALYGNHENPDAKWSWSEEYQSQLYRDNLKMFENISNLAGVAPWVMFDFRSPSRFSPQQGFEFNRKGLVSDRGERKQAWYVMKNYYSH